MKKWISFLIASIFLTIPTYSVFAESESTTISNPTTTEITPASDAATDTTNYTTVIKTPKPTSTSTTVESITIDNKGNVVPYTSTKQSLGTLTAMDAFKKLKEGNMRFVRNQPISRNLLRQAKTTSLEGQFPFAVILSCMDSRGSPELIFDQGLGDVFSIRVAGNVVDTDQLGSMEYATKVIGSKIIVVMGHTQCGAVKGSCKGVKLGNLTALLDKIQLAVDKVQGTSNDNKLNCNDANTIDNIAKQNILDMINDIKNKSSVISSQLQNKEIMLVGAMHQLNTGRVMFFDETGTEIK